MCQSPLEANSRDDITTSMANLTVFTLILVLVQVRYRLSQCLLSFQFKVNSEPRTEDEVFFTPFYATNGNKQYLRRFN
jgi:hypothetical protein